MIKYTGKYKIFLLLVIIAISSVSCRATKDTSRPANTDNTDFYKKYSKIIGVELAGNEDKKFIKAVADWLGTPYLYGGETKKGTDCSGFVQALFKDVYNISLNRTAFDMVKNCEWVGKKNLKAGDLVFFKINGDKISHVGVYINNNKFVHSSTSKGVIVSDLSETYYTKYYYSAGRIKNLK